MSPRLDLTILIYFGKNSKRKKTKIVGFVIIRKKKENTFHYIVSNIYSYWSTLYISVTRDCVPNCIGFTNKKSQRNCPNYNCYPRERENKRENSFLGQNCNKRLEHRKIKLFEAICVWCLFCVRFYYLCSPDHLPVQKSLLQ